MGMRPPKKKKREIRRAAKKINIQYITNIRDIGDMSSTTVNIRGVEKIKGASEGRAIKSGL